MDDFWNKLDVSLGIVFVTLTLCAFTVKYVSIFFTIGLHGKQSQLSTNNVEGNTAFNNQLIYVVTNLMVSKSLFTVLYFYGLVFVIAIHSVVYINPYSEIYAAWENRTTVLILWTVHLLRRLFECIFITKFGKSEMHVFGFLVGLIHYSLVPLSFFCVNSDGDHKTWFTELCHLVAYIVYIFGSVVQCQSHYILYKLKMTYARCGGLPYALPEEALFKYAACPHYMAEILIYFSFFMLTLPGLSFSNASIVIWVASNLSVVAEKQYQYYMLNFPDKLPKKWSKLIPGIW